MSEFENLDQRHFSTKAEELDAHQKQAELFDDEDKIATVISIRRGIERAGESTSNIKQLNESEAQAGPGQMVIAMYKPANDEKYLSDLGTIRIGARSAGISEEEFVEKAIRHEGEHQKSRKAKGVRETDQTLVHLFGHEAIHNTEESAASVHTPFDAYDKERSKVEEYARILYITRKAINDIRVKGDHEKLKQHAEDAGLIEPPQKAA